MARLGAVGDGHGPRHAEVDAEAALVEIGEDEFAAAVEAADGRAGEAEHEVLDDAGAHRPWPAQVGAGEAASDEAGGFEVAPGGLDLGELGHGVPPARPASGAQNAGAL